MRTHEIRIECEDWKPTDPIEDKSFIIQCQKIDRMFCVGCGMRGLYTQPWASNGECYFICTACGTELITKDVTSARSSDFAPSQTLLMKLRALDRVTEWLTSDDIEQHYNIYEYAHQPLT